jgi:hypothetical protein
LGRKVRSLSSRLAQADTNLQGSLAAQKQLRGEAKTLRFQQEKAQEEARKARGDLARARSAYEALAAQHDSLRTHVRNALNDSGNTSGKIEAASLRSLRQWITSTGGSSPNRKDKRTTGTTHLRVTPQKRPPSAAGAIVAGLATNAKDTSEDVPAEGERKAGEGSKPEASGRGLDSDSLAHTVSRQEILLRQAHQRMAQLDERVASQASYIAAKDTALTNMRTSCVRLEREKKILGETLAATEAENKSTEVHAKYLQGVCSALRESHNSTIEWLKAEVSEMQAHICQNQPHVLNAIRKLVHTAETRAQKLRPTLSILVNKTPGQRGVGISGIKAGTALDCIGVRSGDIIEWIDEQRVTDHTVMEKVLNQARPGDLISLLLGTDGHQGSLTKVVRFSVPFVDAGGVESKDVLSPLLGTGGGGGNGEIATRKQLKTIQRLDFGVVRAHEVKIVGQQAGNNMRVGDSGGTSNDATHVTSAGGVAGGIKAKKPLARARERNRK